MSTMKAVVRAVSENADVMMEMKWERSSRESVEIGTVGISAVVDMVACGRCTVVVGYNKQLNESGFRL